MKYIALLLLGAVAARQPESTSLAQISSNARAEAYGSESDSESDDDNNMLQTGEAIVGDDGIIDALTPQKGACEERLWLSEDELNW